MKLKSFTALVVALLLIPIFISGCAASGTALRLDSDQGFKGAARELAEAYLAGQKSGMHPNEAKKLYGDGAANPFYNLEQYRYISTGHIMGQPALCYRVKAGNQAGGNPTWADVWIFFSHNPKIEKTDRFMGLRIAGLM